MLLLATCSLSVIFFSLANLPLPIDIEAGEVIALWDLKFLPILVTLLTTFRARVNRDNYMYLYRERERERTQYYCDRRYGEPIT